MPAPKKRTSLLFRMKNMFIKPDPRTINSIGHSLYNIITLNRVSTAKINPAIIKNRPTF